MVNMKAAFFTHNDAYRPDNRIDYVFSQGRQAIIGGMCELYPTRITPSNFNEEAPNLRDLDVIFSTWGMWPLAPEQLEQLPNLKAVFFAGGSIKKFAGPMLERGIRITSAAEANAIPVAEFCLAQILLAAKGYFINNTCCRNRIFKQEIVGRGAYGETVALIGIGAIARQLLTRLAPFNLRIIAVSNYLENNPELARAMGIDELVTIEEAFKKAYVVSNHLPDLPTNQKIFGAAHFESMRQGATFINTGRGAQVDEAALVNVLRQRTDLTALLDVTCPEPPLPDSPLYTLPNIHLSAHISGSQNDETVRMADFAIEEFRRFLNGLPLEHEVLPELFHALA